MTYQNGGELNLFFDFEYLRGYNHVKVTVSDVSEHGIAPVDTLIDLRELNANRILKKYLPLRDDSLSGDLNSFSHPFPSLLASFFLQTHSSVQLESILHGRNQ